jgi:Tol biopolymer transport system component/tRNA A-37 threonylcarbamoyl transferase component Bud32
MPLDPGTAFGPYQILGLIAAGAMGEVYKAKHSEKEAVVALRILSPDFSKDPEKMQRLEHEARTIATLNDPHFCGLHEIGREGDVHFIVTDYVEGSTLASRLKDGALPLDEALNVAISIAEALNAAHRNGITHRDLKPSNVMLSASGVKLLDFGLAEPRTQKVGMARQAQSSSITPESIEYKAPEQLEGAESDARADVFAFGVVLYEMVTGMKAFQGKNVPLLVTAIATLDPDPLSKAQPDCPPALDHIAKRCLAKNPEDRWQTAHDLLVQLKWMTESGGASLAAALRRQKRERWILAATAAAFFLLALAITPARKYLGNATPTDAFQFRVPVAGLNPSDISLSPDGTMLALVAKPSSQEAAALYVRMVDSPTFRKLGGTDDAALPFWSPDSKSIAFAAGGRLKRVEASGGAPKNLGEAANFAGGAWSGDGIIVFGSPKGLYRVSAEGGTPELITSPEKQEAGHYWPSFLPDGQHFLYLAWSAEAGSRAVFLGELGSKNKTRLMSADSNAAYANPGYIVFHREATLFAQPFDAKKLTMTGEPLHVADQVAFTPTTGRGDFDVSQSGVLTYFQDQSGAGGTSNKAQAVNNYQWGWRDRKGTQIALAGETGTYGDMDLSPDGKLIAVTQGDGAADIWVIDWQRAGVSYRVTLDPAEDINPVWSQPKGDQIAFTTYRKGNADIYIKNANGTGPETPLLDTPANESIEDWSKDGRYIAYKQGPEGAEDIWVLPMFGDRKPFPVVRGPYHKDEPQFSYDGKWLAYTSDESAGMFQVYVISFPGGEQRIPVSKDGGGQPRWREDGKELFFRSPDNGVMAVDIKPGPRIEAGVPHLLFTGLPSTVNRDPTRHQTAVSPDGQRFLLRVPPGPPGQRRGAGSTAPIIFTQFAGGRGGQAAQGQAAQGIVSSGLTVIRNWTAVSQKVAQ